MVNFHTNCGNGCIIIFIYLLTYIILFAKIIIFIVFSNLFNSLKGSRHGFSYSTLAPIQAWEINAP